MTYGNTFPHPVKGCKAISKGSSKTRHPYKSYGEQIVHPHPCIQSVYAC